MNLSSCQYSFPAAAARPAHTFPLETSMSETLSTSPHTTYPEQVAEYIRSNIRSGELRPGDTIKESMLATRLHVSRAPVREALHILIREHLVTSTPQHSKIVCLLSPTEILDAFRFSGILEAGGAVDGLAQWTDEDSEELTGMLRTLHGMQKASPHEKFLRTEELHRKLLCHCSNRILLERARFATDRITHYLYHSSWLGLLSTVNVITVYSPLVEAMRSRDPDGVWKRVRACFEVFGTHMSYFGTEPEQRQPARRGRQVQIAWA